MQVLTAQGVKEIATFSFLRREWLRSHFGIPSGIVRGWFMNGAGFPGPNPNTNHPAVLQPLAPGELDVVNPIARPRLDSEYHLRRIGDVVTGSSL